MHLVLDLPMYLIYNLQLILFVLQLYLVLVLQVYLVDVLQVYLVCLVCFTAVFSICINYFKNKFIPLTVWSIYFTTVFRTDLKLQLYKCIGYIIFLYNTYSMLYYLFIYSLLINQLELFL